MIIILLIIFKILLIIYFFFFFNDTATTEIYTLHIVGSVRCVQETAVRQKVLEKSSKRQYSNQKHLKKSEDQNISKDILLINDSYQDNSPKAKTQRHQNIQFQPQDNEIVSQRKVIQTQIEELPYDQYQQKNRSQSYIKTNAGDTQLEKDNQFSPRHKSHIKGGRQNLRKQYMQDNPDESSDFQQNHQRKNHSNNQDDKLIKLQKQITNEDQPQRLISKIFPNNSPNQGRNNRNPNINNTNQDEQNQKSSIRKHKKEKQYISDSDQAPNLDNSLANQYENMKIINNESSVDYSKGVVEPDNNIELYQVNNLSLIHISEPTRLGMISYAVFCLKKKKKKQRKQGTRQRA
eukprot:TRINITY_DN10422_c0_g1_i2.p1 TRINITY_DN10422_c0_g1~~TRINITY_DN10422_c0_g1_i2.p1  ORF type:complete len:348 (-),score=63.45 TRINITY_DN10422_c0_g1_i2:30-1073(-)